MVSDLVRFMNSLGLSRQLGVVMLALAAVGGALIVCDWRRIRRVSR